MWMWVAPQKFSHALLQVIHVQLGVKFVNWATPQPVYVRGSMRGREKEEKEREGRGEREREREKREERERWEEEGDRKRRDQ